ncbi:hypothetical protein J3459_005967 [Metarhizium acridum]|nr:hypothetical protein J3459_005967 [Metarhizium acridum]
MSIDSPSHDETRKKKKENKMLRGLRKRSPGTQPFQVASKRSARLPVVAWYFLPTTMLMRSSPVAERDITTHTGWALGHAPSFPTILAVYVPRHFWLRSTWSPAAEGQDCQRPG